MNPWSFIETVLDVIYYLCNWRFTLCFFGGIALAVVVAGWISAEPLNIIAAGVIVVAGFVIGWRWDGAH